MSVPESASWSARLLSRAFTSEGLLGMTGCAMAVASGSFAIYMNMHGPWRSNGDGSHYFTVFAQLSPRQRPERIAPVAAAAPIAPDGVDPVVTGSIPRHGIAGSGEPKPPANPVEAAAVRPIVPDLVLRQIDGAEALVEIDDKLVIYKIGDIIPGAGRFLAMTHQGGRPALETTNGLIVEQR